MKPDGKSVLSFRSNLRDKKGIDTGSKEKEQEPKYQKLCKGLDTQPINKQMAKHSKPLTTQQLLHVKEKWKQFTSVVLGSNTSVSAAAGCTSSVLRGRKKKKKDTFNLTTTKKKKKRTVQMNYSNQADPEPKALLEEWKDRSEVCVQSSESIISAAYLSCLRLSDCVAQHKPKEKR